MSHLLKRTKKSCLKIFRKISTSKQLFAKKADDDSTDETTNNNNNNNNKNNNNGNSAGSSSSSGSSNSSRSNNSNNNSNRNIKNNTKANNGGYKDYASEIETSPMSREKINHSFRRSSESLPSNTYHQNSPQKNHQQHYNHLNNNSNNNNSNNSNNNSACMVNKDNVDLLEDDSPNTTILHKLTARLFLTADGYDFQRLQQLRSDTGSEVVQFDMETNLQDNIVFEKVNFKDDIRYLRHTPSNSSLDNFRPSSVATTPDYDEDFDLDNDWQVNEQCQNHRPWDFDSLTNQFTNFGFQANSNRETFRPAVNMSLGSKLNGNLQNVVISEERNKQNNKLTPIVKWDINGNSLDDDDDLLPHEYLEDFDKRLSKRIAAVKQMQFQDDNENESEDSSLRSSSTTLETWVDEDLLLENSLEFAKDNRCLIKS